MEIDHLYIEARVHEARRLRDEAAGELLAAGWRRVREFASRLSKAAYESLRPRHHAHH